MYQKSSELEFNKAVSDLQLMIRNDVADRQEIKFILMEMLGYPSVQRAQQHHNSSRLGTNDLLSKQIEIQKKVKQKDITGFQICSCCGMLLQNDFLPFTTSFKQINLGIGVILFFKDFLYYSFIFLFMFCLYSIYAIATNVEDFSKESDAIKLEICGSVNQGLCDISAGSKVLYQNQSKRIHSYIQAWIGVALVIIWGVLNIIKTHFQQKEIAQIEEKRVSASDFTLMIQNFPKVHLGQTQQQALNLVQDIFNRYYQTEKLKKQCKYPYEVVSVCIARSLYLQNRRNVQHKQKVMNQLYDRQQIFRQWIRYRKQNVKFPSDYKARQVKYEEYNNYFTQVFEKQIFPKVNLQEKNIIFVTLRHSKAREEIEESNAVVSIFNLWKYFKESDFPVHEVKISKAPEPEQIKWENIGFSSGQRTMRRILVWIVTLLLIGISLGISIGVSKVSEQNGLKQKYIAASVAVSLIVTLINLGIQVSIIYFSSLQYEYISSWQQSSLAIKIAVGQLANSICIPIIVAMVIKNTVNGRRYLNGNGLANDVFFIALFNILVPVTYIFDFYELCLKAIRWWKSRPYTRLQMYGQKELNKYYGNYKFDIGYQYAYLIKTAIFTSFFVTLQPIIAIFAPFALVFFYMTTKRNLFDHIQRPSYHYATTNNTVDVILQFSLLFFGLGSAIVNNLSDQLDPGAKQDRTYTPNLIIIFISIGFLLVVPFRIFYCCIKKPELQNKDYFQKKMLIYTDYDRTNPITKQSAISDFQYYIRNLDEEQGLPDAVQLIKLHSTIQNRQTIKMDINFRNSISRMSKLQFKMDPVEPRKQTQPQFNYDKHFYEQIVQQKSVHFGKPDSPQKNQPPAKGNLFKISEHSRVEAEQSNINFNSKTK